MKTRFKLVDALRYPTDAVVSIIPNPFAVYKVRQCIRIQRGKKVQFMYFTDSSLERFAINILKALKSKKLKP